MAPQFFRLRDAPPDELRGRSFAREPKRRKNRATSAKGFKEIGSGYRRRIDRTFIVAREDRSQHDVRFRYACQWRRNGRSTNASTRRNRGFRRAPSVDYSVYELNPAADSGIRVPKSDLSVYVCFSVSAHCLKTSSRSDSEGLEPCAVPGKGPRAVNLDGNHGQRQHGA